MRRAIERASLWKAITIGLGVYSTAFVVYAIGPFDVPTDTRALVSDLVFVPAGLIVAILAWHAAFQPGVSPQSRRAWTLLGLAFIAFWAGDALYVSFELVAGEVPGTTVADVAYLVYYPLALAGLLAFSKILDSGAQRLRFWIDAATVALGGALVVWYFVLGPLASGEHEDLLETMLSMAYPVGDLVLLLGVAVVALRAPGDVPRRAIGLLLAGLLLSLAADVAYGAQALEDTVEPGRWVDATYLVAWAILGAGAYVAAHPPKRGGERERDAAPRGPTPVLPYLSVALGYGMILTSVGQSWTPTVAGLIVGAGLLTALVIARQVVAVKEDVRFVADREKRKGEARFRSLVQNASDIILVVDDDLVIDYATPSLERILGCPPDEFHRARLLDHVYPDDRAIAERLFARVATRPGAVDTDEMRLARRDGTPLSVEISVHNMTDDPDIRGAVITIHDIDARKRLEVKLAQQAYHDTLTGLAHRPLFTGSLATAMHLATEGEYVIGVLYLDIDDLKTINDSLGHRAGDRALVEVSKRIHAALRTTDLLARVGGDEFAVLLDGPTSIEAITAVCRRICLALAEPYVLDGIEIALGASIGIALNTTKGDTSEDLLRNADIAMYLAKSSGKARFATFEPGMQIRARERLDVASALRHALEREEFEVHYQPIVDLATNRGVGAEALIRWRRPDRELVLPGAFISLAEETGLIVPIGLWVLEQACLAATGWTGRRLAMAPFVAVNVSARQLDDLGFSGQVAAILERTGLPPARLVLEITESLTMVQPELLIERLRALKALGLQVAIDDFGTGFSSLSYLRRLPVDKVKIDRSFVIDLDRASGSALVHGIIELARSLGHSSVAEGIETADQATALAAFGCEFGQGFYYSRPVPADKVIGLLAARSLPTPLPADAAPLAAAVAAA